MNTLIESSNTSPRERVRRATPLVAFALALALSLALAAAGTTALAADDVALTSDRVDRFLDSLPDVEVLGQKYGDASEKMSKQKKNKRMNPHGAAGMAGMAPGGDFSHMMPSEAQMERAASPFTSNLEEIRASEGYGDMVSTVKKHGFSSVEEWAAVGDRAMRAFASLQMADEIPELDAQMEDMRKQLAQSGMPKAQQEQMLKMMDTGRVQMKKFQDVPQADLNAVRPHLKRFEELGQSQMQRSRNR